jgi:RNA polymerase sigma-70 factor (ECF subfamily)
VTLFPQAPDEDLTLALVARAQSGDDDALNGLFERYHDHLLLAVRLRLGRQLRSVLESADVFQSVALEAIRDLGDFTPRGADSFRHYLNRLVLNKIRDRARYFGAAKRQGTQRASQTHLEELSSPPESVTYHDASGRFESLEREIALLPEDMRQVLMLRTVDGLPSQEVAQLIGKSDASVRKTYSRAVARLCLRIDSKPAP